MTARETMAHQPTCFETELARALDQRNDEPPMGDFVTRFERFIDDPSSARCKRVTAGARSTTWTTPGSGGRGTSTRGSWSASLGPSDQEDELPLTGDWFYKRRGCERSPR